MRLPSPPPYICPSPPSGDILFDDEEDRLEALVSFIRYNTHVHTIDEHT